MPEKDHEIDVNLKGCELLGMKKLRDLNRFHAHLFENEPDSNTNKDNSDLF